MYRHQSFTRLRFRSALRFECLERRSLLATGAIGGVSSSVLPGDLGQVEVDATRILVRYRPEAESVAREAHGLAWEVRDVGLVSGLKEVRLSPGVSVEDALAAYRDLPDVLYAEPNRIYQVQESPTDPRFNEQWALNKIDASQAWDVVNQAAGVIVAIIDTGVDYRHPDLAANMWTNTAEAQGAPGVDDDGTHAVDDLTDDQILTQAWKEMGLRLQAATDQHAAMTDELEHLAKSDPKRFTPDQIWILIRAIKVQSQILQLYIGDTGLDV